MDCIQATWPAPKNIKAVTTTRAGGVSAAPYAALNLGDHVGDAPENVRVNRARIREAQRLPAEPSWLRQVHGIDVVDAASTPIGTSADGSFTDEAGVVCAVLTADCLPIFLCDRRATVVGLLHAGWRGLAAGIVETGIKRIGIPGPALLAWFGPAIGPRAFEVGDEVRVAFVGADPEAAPAFVPHASGRWLADLYQLARLRLQHQGVTAIYGGEHCTVTQRDLFYSYRRDGVTGRMASLIWFS